MLRYVSMNHEIDRVLLCAGSVCLHECQALGSGCSSLAEHLPLMDKALASTSGMAGVGVGHYLQINSTKEFLYLTFLLFSMFLKNTYRPTNNSKT